MEFRHLLICDADRIRRITLNRPERLNALNVRIGVELLQALEAADRDSEVRVVVLTGAGRAFCAGDDLRGMDEPGAPVRRFDDPIKQYVQGEGRWPLIVARMRAMSKPVIAMVNGHAHGAGFNLALGCDLRVIADDATLAIPFSRRGIGTGTNLLQQFVGIARRWNGRCLPLRSRRTKPNAGVSSTVSQRKINSRPQPPNLLSNSQVDRRSF
jgi:2-(1,2-epoxy-1,2-dihydrophenyl)acetyl-CoA isomerase